MSYSQSIKAELCSAKFHCENCETAMLYGFLLFHRGITDKAFSVSTESRAVASVISEAIAAVSGAIVTVIAPNRNSDRRKQFLISISDVNDIGYLLEKCYNNAVLDKHTIANKAIESNCCRKAFLRGVFMACGSISNPDVEYHMEFSSVHKKLCLFLQQILLEENLDFKISYRGTSGVNIVYIKESEMIEYTLAYLGAVKSSMEMMNLKIEKELRNNVNRQINCETANIEKTVTAAMKQIEKIKKLKSSKKFELLPIELREVADLRLSNPEMSLRELVEMSDGKISRSGLNHRLKKICDIADELQ